MTPDEAAIADAHAEGAHRVRRAGAPARAARPTLAGETVTLGRHLLVAPQLDFLAQTPEWEPLTAASAAIWFHGSIA